MLYSSSAILWLGIRVCAVTVILSSLFSGSASAACSWTTLTSGTTASATQVMNNFDCLAPLTSPAFNGTGMFPPTSGVARGGIVRVLSDNTNVVLDQGAIPGIPWTYWAQVSDLLDLSRAYPLSLQPNGGNLGVGDLSPPSVLAVNGKAALPANSGTVPTGIVRIKAANTNIVLDQGALPGAPWSYWMQIADSTDISVKYPLTLQPNGGNVGIGTSSPGQKLHVSGTIRQTGCTTAGTLSVNTSGDIICTSDARLKDVRGPYTAGLDAIARISPQLFRFKPSDNNRTEIFVHAGFIAQNVKSAIPEAVALQKSGYYSLDTTAILAASVNAIKELKAENQKLRHEISFMRTAQGAQYRELSMRLDALAQGKKSKPLNTSASMAAQGVSTVKRRGS